MFGFGPFSFARDADALPASNFIAVFLGNLVLRIVAPMIPAVGVSSL